MRYVHNGLILLALTVGITCSAWGQGGNRGGRAAGAQQAGAPAATPAGAPAGAQRGGRNGGAAGVVAPTTSEFYNYDTSASSGPSIPDGAPTETHQKITVNGEALAYTARVAYRRFAMRLRVRRKRTFSSPPTLKEGVTDLSGRPVLVLCRRCIGRLGQLAGVRRLGSEAHEVGE